MKTAVRAIAELREHRHNSATLADKLDVTVKTGTRLVRKLCERGVVTWFAYVEDRFHQIDFTDEALEAMRLGYDDEDIARGAFPGGR